MRKGDYRIIYEIKDDEVIVVVVSELLISCKYSDYGV